MRAKKHIASHCTNSDIALPCAHRPDLAHLISLDGFWSMPGLRIRASGTIKSNRSDSSFCRHPRIHAINLFLKMFVAPVKISFPPGVSKGTKQTAQMFHVHQTSFDAVSIFQGIITDPPGNFGSITCIILSMPHYRTFKIS